MEAYCNGSSRVKRQFFTPRVALETRPHSLAKMFPKSNPNGNTPYQMTETEDFDELANREVAPWDIRDDTGEPGMEPGRGAVFGGSESRGTL